MADWHDLSDEELARRGRVQLRHGHYALASEILSAYCSRMIAQDRAIVETQHPERIPLDLRQELHIRSDRLGLEYRRWLKELGVSYGTAGDEPPARAGTA